MDRSRSKASLTLASDRRSLPRLEQSRTRRNTNLTVWNIGETGKKKFLDKGLSLQSNFSLPDRKLGCTISAAGQKLSKKPSLRTIA